MPVYARMGNFSCVLLTFLSSPLLLLQQTCVRNSIVVVTMPPPPREKEPISRAHANITMITCGHCRPILIATFPSPPLHTRTIAET